MSNAPQAAVWLTPDDYTKGDPFMREKAQVFAIDWLPLAAVGQCSSPGDFVTHGVGGWPLLALHGPDGVHAFRNTCRHQNMMVVEQPAGNATLLQCRYHGWKYRLDGTFESAPPLVAPAGSDAAANALARVKSQQWQGLLFATLGGDQAPPFDVPDRLAPGDDALAHVASIVTDVACNWKLAIEHRIADGWSFAWPLTVARESAGMRVVDQIVPRSFLRTRVVSHLFAAAGSEDSLRSQANGWIASLKTRAEESQSRAASGDTHIVDAPDAHAFRAQVVTRLKAD